jgi:hypothetical protein
VENFAYPIALLIAFGSPYAQPTKWQRIGNQIGTAFVTSRADFVTMREDVNSNIPLF